MPAPPQHGAEGSQRPASQGRVDLRAARVASSNSYSTVRIGEAAYTGGVGPAESALHEAVRFESEQALRLTVLASPRINYRALEPLATLASLIDEPHPKGFSISRAGVAGARVGA